MPIYQYKCPHCGIEKEFQHRMVETPSILCDTCAGSYGNMLRPMIRQIAYKPGVSFKGSGFHTNDDPSARVPR